MRIISDYTDYYDSVQHWNQGDERIWIRKKLDVTYSTIAPFSQYGQSVLNNWILVGFCGKLYPANVIQIDASYPRTYPHYIEAYEEYDFDYDPSVKEKKETWGDWDRSAKVNAWHEIKNHPYFLKHFLEMRVPIFTVRFNDSRRWQEMRDNGRSQIAVDIDYQPSLESLGFYRIFDSYSAYQEIDMYLNNQLAQADDPAQITDNIVMRDAKGFDEWTFKTHPTKKR